MLNTNSTHIPTTSSKRTKKRKTLVESQMELNTGSLNNLKTPNNLSRVEKMAWSGRGQKAALTVSTARNAPSSSTTGNPQALSPMPHHGQRPSLAGFDPFSTDEQYSISPSKIRISNARIVASPSHINCTKSAHGLSERRSQDSRDHSPVSKENDRRQPPSPLKSSSTTDSPSRDTANDGSLKKVEAVSLNFRHDHLASQAPPGGSKLLAFVRHGHRRSKSCEANRIKDRKIAAVATQDSIPISTKSEQDQTSGAAKTLSKLTSSGIVQDLMDLKDKFTQLQIPTLAKPSPTSFLTGKGDEAVRTSEYEPTPFQMELPSLPEVVAVARLNDFVENYRRMDQNFDLEQLVGCSSIDLQNVKIKEHVPITQMLLESGDGLRVQGFLSKGSNADNRLEAVVFEGHRYFVVIFRGTTEQQTKVLGSSKPKRRATPLDLEQENVEVYSGFKEEYKRLEHDCFTLIDNLSEQNPFCDVVFSGYSFGAAMATLAAFRYATARPMMRVGCFTLASPKVGFSLFRHVVNSLPNLKVVRLEHGQDSKCQGPTAGGWHVGHTLVLNGSFGPQLASQNKNKAVQAYKFDTPKLKKFKTTHPDLRNYVTTLEEMARLNIPWVKDFVNTAGQGVVVNNEARQVV